MAAILVFKNNGTAVMFVYQSNPVKAGLKFTEGYLSQIVLWELNSFLMQTRAFCLLLQYICMCAGVVIEKAL